MLAWLLLLAPAWAGDIVVQATVPADIQIGTVPLAHTWGPVTLRITGVDAGVAGIRVLRGDKVDTLDVVVPDSGAAVLVVDKGAPSTHPAEAPVAGPMVELRAAPGQHFAVVLDGVRTTVVGEHYPVQLEGISAGPHQLELRTSDLTVVWARAELDLQADDKLVVTGQEGYAPIVSGRQDALRLEGAAADVRSGAEDAAPPPTQTIIALPPAGDLSYP